MFSSSNCQNSLPNPGRSNENTRVEVFFHSLHWFHQFGHRSSNRNFAEPLTHSPSTGHLQSSQPPSSAQMDPVRLITAQTNMHSQSSLLTAPNALEEISLSRACYLKPLISRCPWLGYMSSLTQPEYWMCIPHFPGSSLLLTSDSGSISVVTKS